MPRSTTVALLIGAVALLIPPVADAKIIVDGRRRVLRRFIACMNGKPCNAQRVMSGQSLRYFLRSAEKRKRFTLLSWGVVTLAQLPRRAQQRWTARWDALRPALVQAGYSPTALAQFGRHRGLVIIRSGIALALVRVTLKIVGRDQPKTESFHAVLRQDPHQPRRWRVDFQEDSHFALRRYLTRLRR